MQEIQTFYDALADLPSLAEKIIESDRKIIGYLCSYVPEELILAAGFHPMRLFSSNPEIRRAHTHLQSYCCSPVKGILEDALSGRLNFLHGTVFPHACDTIQRLSDIWRMNTKFTFFTDLVWPTKLGTDSSDTYVLDILKNFKQELEAAAGCSIEDSDLISAIDICNRIRSGIHSVYQLNAGHHPVLSSSDLYTLIKGSMVMDRETAAQLLDKIVEKLKGQPPEDRSKPSLKKRIVVSGAMCDFPQLTQTIEAAGARIAGDDFCTGQRWFDGQIELNRPPLEAIAQRYINRMSCPAKHTTLTARADQMIALVEELNADGVIFLLTKFCDPHAFDYPYIKNCLDEKKIKHLLLETDDPGQGAGQMTTRIETFVQMI